jgi:hypothetical protein
MTDAKVDYGGSDNTGGRDGPETGVPRGGASPTRKGAGVS